MTNRKMWRARVFTGVETLADAWYTMTLTAPGYAHRNNTTLSVLQRGWGKLSRQMRYHAPENMHYVRVYERHASGEYHAHFVMSAYFGERWVKDKAPSCGLGYMVEHTAVRNTGHAVGYVSKYLTKLRDPLPSGTRRLQTSQSWPKWDKPDTGDWQYASEIRQRDLIEWIDKGLNAKDLEDNHIVTYDDFPYGFYERLDDK